jgi:hypothetical protein
MLNASRVILRDVKLAGCLILALPDPSGRDRFSSLLRFAVGHALLRTGIPGRRCDCRRPESCWGVRGNGTACRLRRRQEKLDMIAFVSVVLALAGFLSSLTNSAARTDAVQVLVEDLNDAKMLPADFSRILLTKRSQT